MAFPTAVNNQIADSVTQDDIDVLVVTATEALALLYKDMAISIRNSELNAIANQQNTRVIGEAALTSCIEHLLGEFELKNKQN